MNFFDHKDLGNHLLQLCPNVVKHPVYVVMLCSLGVYYIRSYDVFDRGVLQVDKHGTTS